MLIAGIITLAGWLVFAIALEFTRGLNEGLILRGLGVCLLGMVLVGVLSIASRAERDTPDSGRSDTVVLPHPATHGFCGGVAFDRRRRDLGERVVLRCIAIRSTWVVADRLVRCRPVDSRVGWIPRAASRVALGGWLGRCCGYGRLADFHGRL